MPIDLTLIHCMLNPRKVYNWETGKAEDAAPDVIEFYDWLYGKGKDMLADEWKNLFVGDTRNERRIKKKILSKRHKK